MDSAQEQKSILVHYCEVGLKGKNQPEFRRQLRENVRRKLKKLGLKWTIEDAHGYQAIHIPADQTDTPLEPVFKALRQVFGIAWMSCAKRIPHGRFTLKSGKADVAALEKELLGMANRQFEPGKSFVVRVNRGDKTLPFQSPALEAQFGSVLRQNTPWQKVSLKNPDATFHIDVRKDSSYVFSEKLKGPGGLPVGTAGRVLTLLSGGIDSPPAAYLMAKRGCKVDFIHFTATSMQQDEALQYKVWRLAEKLSEYTFGSRLFLVPYVYFDLALMREKIDYEVILFRRFMARVAAQLARNIRARALVTGDNLSQVASQTLPNIVSTSRATEMPILRPLIGFDKEEIMELARKIGTYDISVEPYKDCCALISGSPKTVSRHDRMEILEKRAFPDYQKLIDQTLAEAICLYTTNPRNQAEEPPEAKMCGAGSAVSEGKAAEPDRA